MSLTYSHRLTQSKLFKSWFSRAWPSIDWSVGWISIKYTRLMVHRSSSTLIVHCHILVHNCACACAKGNKFNLKYVLW